MRFYKIVERDESGYYLERDWFGEDWKEYGGFWFSIYDFIKIPFIPWVWMK